MLGFRNAYLFDMSQTIDISQTNGVELPAIYEVGGDPGENIERLIAFLKANNIAVAYIEKIAPALGMSYGGRIALLPGQSKAEEFSTLVHEAARKGRPGQMSIQEPNVISVLTLTSNWEITEEESCGASLGCER